ncbi:MAG: site-2 protease family protein [Clostridiales bacterium]|jgi:Zn-dependent protease|nr:site-2 protease family protein [Clostridiales bacterium]
MFRNFNIQEMLLRIPILLISFTVHEFFHGWTAYRLGDNTAKYDGRLSLNPLKHIDPVGALLLIVVGFGWAKPVMVDYRNLRNPKQDMAVIAFAGPLSNFLLAFVFTLLIIPCVFIPVGPLSDIPYNFALQGIFTNVGLGIFNLLPLPPLDGSKVLGSLLPINMYYKYMSIERYGFIILILLSFTGVLGMILSPMINAATSGYIFVANWILQLFV